MLELMRTVTFRAENMKLRFLILLREHSSSSDKAESHQRLETLQPTPSHADVPFKENLLAWAHNIIHNKWSLFVFSLTRTLNVLYLGAVAWRRQHVDFCSLASLIFEWGWRSSHKSETLSFKINITHQLLREMIGSLSVARLINFLLSISLIENFFF